MLDEIGVELTLAHATRLKAIAAAKVKTDRLDSDLLAQLLRADLIPAAYRIAREARGPRDLLRLRLRLVGKRVSCLNSIERIREKYHVSRHDQLDPWYQQQVEVYDAQVALIAQQIHDVEATLHALGELLEVTGGRPGRPRQPGLAQPATTTERDE